MNVTSEAPATRVSVTVFHGDNSIDVSAPSGTAVARLLTLLRIDPYEFGIKVMGLDGQPVNLDAALGDAVPAGSVLTVTGAAPRQRRSGVLAAAEAAGEDRPAMTVPAIAFVVAVQVCAISLPFALPPSSLAWWPQLVAGALTLLMALVLCRRPLLRTAAGALAVPALLAVPFAALVPPATPAGARVAVALAAGVGAVAAFGIWAFTRQAAPAASAALWGVIAFAVAVSVPTPVSVTDVAPVLLLAGATVAVLAPRLALPVPESQLVDLPLLTTSAPAVRQPTARPPARVTPRRVGFTVRTAEMIAETCMLGGVAIAALASGFVAAEAGSGGLRSIGAIIELVAVAALFGLLGRTHRSALMRSAPRAGAVLVTVTALATAVFTGHVSAPAAILGLCLLGLVLVWGAVLATREPRSALLARIGDLVHGLALTLLPPAALLASGLFEAVREVAS
ncbi:MAG: hypothetical protein Q3997_07105 [Propionibacteriaceae bacterium]|nr:hypothetical protein [Propionibacteriaceae bacterium]